MITLKYLREYARDVLKTPIGIELADLSESGHGAVVYVELGLIEIDKKAWMSARKANPKYLKGMLLHEIGHVHTSKNRKSVIDRELYAQLWAIKKTKELNDTELRKWLIKRFKSWNFKGKYLHKELRRYKLARQKFIKNKMRY